MGVLVLPLLDRIQSVSGNLEDILQFAKAADTMVAALHQRGVVHGDLKPSAFMRDPVTGKDVLSGEPHSGEPHDDDLQHLPGTRGWVFAGTPAVKHGVVDHVGQAALVGWRLDLLGFGEPETTFSEAQESVRRALERATKQGEGDRRIVVLLKGVHDLLHLKVPFGSRVWGPSAGEHNKENHPRALGRPVPRFAAVKF